MPELNEIVHQPVRLRIMAALVALEPGNEVDFTYLRDLLAVTDGNLGGYVLIAPAIIVLAALTIWLVSIIVFTLLRVVVPIFYVIGYIVVQGGGAPSWEFLTAMPRDGMTAGGVLPAIVGTLALTAGTAIVAVPIGLGGAIYLSEYARPRLRRIVKPVLEVLAGIPTVVYGYFAALTVAPMIRLAGQQLGLEVASEAALRAAIARPVARASGLQPRLWPAEPG